jgi:hypothetical protein
LLPSKLTAGADVILVSSGTKEGLHTRCAVQAARL